MERHGERFQATSEGDTRPASCFQGGKSNINFAYDMLRKIVGHWRDHELSTLRGSEHASSWAP